MLKNFKPLSKEQTRQGYIIQPEDIPVVFVGFPPDLSMLQKELIVGKLKLRPNKPKKTVVGDFSVTVNPGKQARVVMWRDVSEELKTELSAPKKAGARRPSFRKAKSE